MNKSETKGGVYKMKSVGNRELCVKYAIGLSAANERSISLNEGNNTTIVKT
jgi:hypothetical protein